MRSVSGTRTAPAAFFVGGLAIGLLAPAQADPAPATVPTTVVDPASLPVGATPQVPWVRGTTLIQPASHRQTALAGDNPSCPSRRTTSGC